MIAEEFTDIYNCEVRLVGVNITLKNKKILSAMFWGLILLSCFQNIELYKVGSSALKLFHIYSLIFVFVMIIYRRCIFPNKIILLYFIFAAIVSLINISKWGFDGLCFNYMFGLYILIVFCSLGNMFDLNDWLKIFIKVAVVIIIAIYINIAKNLDAIIYFFKNSWVGHPEIKTFFGGGVNLEATWIALFNFSFVNSRVKIPYFFLSLLISVLYASRVGFIINVLYIFWIIAPNMMDKNILKTFILILGLLGVMLTAYNTGILNILLQRFIHIGSDNGSIGRLRMWRYAFKTIDTYPFGCGLGNNIAALSRVSGGSFDNDNLHNIYLQNFIDLGWIGGCFYILIIVGFIFKETKNIFKNPFVAMLFIYIICSSLQFSGGEPIMFCILGIYLCLNKKINNKQQTT